MHTHDSLNALLRGEIAATETYQQALAKVGDDPRAAELHKIRDAHRTAANTLRQHVHEHGGKPDQGSGGWGVYAKSVAAAASIFGDTAALKALKEGEEYGLKDYEKSPGGQHPSGRLQGIDSLDLVAADAGAYSCFR